MRPLALVLVTAALGLTTACAGQAEQVPGATSSEGLAEETSPSESPGETSSASPGESSAASVGPTTLVGAVGTPEDPDAFVITLTDEAGAPVTELPAGDYRIQVSDPSDIHNFHFVGGAVDETTTVPELVETTFDVTLEPGAYTYVCDPHPRMVGDVTVT